jgi:hypothetical protein
MIFNKRHGNCTVNPELMKTVSNTRMGMLRRARTAGAEHAALIA